MNDTTQSHNGMEASAPHLELRQLPVETLETPADLFDPRDAINTGDADLPLPLTVYRSGARHVVIDGCKRLAAARSAGKSGIGCMVLTPQPDTARAALLRMSLNRSRPLRFFEKLLFVTWLKTNCDKRQYREMCASLHLDNSERHEFEQLAACDSRVIDAVYEGILERGFAPEVQRLGSTDREALLSFARKYSFSRQTQRELLDWLPELAFREKCSIGAILSLGELAEIEKSTKLNGPQKIDRLRGTLFNRRFPTLARAKQEWDQLAARCNPDQQRVQFKPSEAFEKNRLELKITVTTAEQAKNIFSHLGALEPSQWDRLIYPAQLYH